MEKPQIEKPQMVRRIGIRTVNESNRYISMDMSDDDLWLVRDFGVLERFSGRANRHSFHLEVDARYDFKQVVEYIKSL